MPHGAWRGGCIAGLWLLPNSLQAACDQEIWQAAFSITQQGATRVGTPELPWSAWSAAWLPFAQQVLDQSAQSILECPEGSMAAVAHGLLAMDEVSEFASYESIKTLHHALQMPPLRDEMSWQDYGMLTSASLFHFMYYKWVNVPQDNDVAETAAEDVTMSPAMLRPHHEFLFRSFIGPFVASGVYDLPMTENSVFFSEAFAFASFCHLHQVDLVAESGVYKGASTEMWSLFAKEVAAVDISLTQEAEQVAERHPNVKLYTGDGQTLLPQLLRQSARAAVFIDGPKGELAIRLALSLCELPQVAFVAIHDMGPYKRELHRLGAFFFSDEDWFQDGSRARPLHAFAGDRQLASWGLLGAKGSYNVQPLTEAVCGDSTRCDTTHCNVTVPNFLDQKGRPQLLFVGSYFALKYSRTSLNHAVDNRGK